MTADGMVGKTEVTNGIPGELNSGPGLDHLLELARLVRDRDFETNCFLPEDDRNGRICREWDSYFPASGSLRGVGLGVKDLFRVAGLPTRAGSFLPPSVFEGPEALSVSLLKSAGAVVVGKTVSTEFAYFEPGPTRNPLDHSRTPGGSSSGSAAAVAAGLCDLALGTQTIGSIIRPAAFCGVIGFKPTLGLIPLDGVVPFSPSADHAGLFARNLSVIASALAAIDPSAIPGELPGLLARSSGKGLFHGLLPEQETACQDPSSQKKPSIGLVTGPLMALASPEAVRAVESAVDILRSLGYEIISADPFPDLESIRGLHQDLVAREFADVHEEWFAKHGHLYRPGSRSLVERGRAVGDARLAEARSSMGAVLARVEELMDRAGVDLWISPSTVGVAPRGIASTGDPVMNLPWTHTGQPAITLPFGRDGDGLPFGLQLSGRFGGDAALLMQTSAVQTDLAGKHDPPRP